MVCTRETVIKILHTCSLECTLLYYTPVTHTHTHTHTLRIWQNQDETGGYSNRRPKLQSLYDVFVNVRDDEKEHWKTLCNLVQYDDMQVCRAVVLPPCRQLT